MTTTDRQPRLFTAQMCRGPRKSAGEGDQHDLVLTASPPDSASLTGAWVFTCLYCGDSFHVET